jgi:hypothetical protein
MIAYLRSKRQLIARNTDLAARNLELSGIVAKQDEQLADLREVVAEYDRALTALSASFDRTRIRKELAEVVREETAWKRLADGAGDE